MSRSEDGFTDPNSAVPLWRCDDLALHGRQREADDLLLNPDVNVALHDAIDKSPADPVELDPVEVQLEEDFRASEAFVCDDGLILVGLSVIDAAVGGGRGPLQLRLEVDGEIRELLCDVADGLALGD
jgi:hypothetical protein